jgi:hypothetical protein
LIWSIFGTTEEAAEKGIDLLRDFGQGPQGLKPGLILRRLRHG